VRPQAEQTCPMISWHRFLYIWVLPKHF